MEELQSTEILDREILEDARKKAHRILKTAEDTVKTQALEWEQKASAALEELKLKYARQRDDALREIMSRLPVEKRRIKTQTIDRLLDRAVENWYAGLERSRVLAILTNELKLRLDASGEFRVTGAEPERAFFHKLSREEAEGILRALLPGRNFSLEEYGGDDAFPELVIENSAVRVIASINRAVDFFLHRNRAELARALLGSGFLDDEGEKPC